MAPGRLPGGDSAGETLIELLVAMSILGVAVVALVSGIGTSVLVSDVHRKEATAGAVVRTYSEAIEAAVDAPTSGYNTTCAGVSAYSAPAGFSAPSGYTAKVTAIAYWNGSAFGSTCSADVGVQKLSLLVSSTDNRARESLDLIIRQPCRAADVACS
jgi:prepilin-type N-terminal cleavage/methylation domain-containing protein